MGQDITYFILKDVDVLVFKNGTRFNVNYVDLRYDKAIDGNLFYTRKEKEEDKEYGNSAAHCTYSKIRKLLTIRSIMRLSSKSL